MTKQVEELTQGEALTRVAMLEAELAELRGRVCVPDGYKVVPVEPTIDMAAAGRDSSGGFMTLGMSEQIYRAMLAAAPAPVELVEQEPVSYYERAHGEKSPTHGMSLDERIAHVGGRTNAAGYMEFGSVMAVSALIDHVLRDSPAPQPAPVAAQDVAGLHLLERIEKHLTNWLELDICECEFGHNCGYNDVIRDRNALRGLIAAHQSGGAR